VGMYGFALIATIQIVVAWLVKDLWPWRWVFLGYAVAGVYWSIANAIGAFGDRDTAHQLDSFGARFQWSWQWLILAAIMSLAGFDLYRRRSRDWLHWTGIGYITAWVVSQSLVILMHRLATS
ncbi:MAG TPA: hypothetical protein VFB80_12025, partial [Pirellulaceae bacterium]|nr:hypothetical protein [Pirellulaceae bacterium]